VDVGVLESPRSGRGRSAGYPRLSAQPDVDKATLRRPSKRERCSPFQSARRAAHEVRVAALGENCASLGVLSRGTVSLDHRSVVTAQHCVYRRPRRGLRTTPQRTAAGRALAAVVRTRTTDPPDPRAPVPSSGLSRLPFLLRRTGHGRGPLRFRALSAPPERGSCARHHWRVAWIWGDRGIPPVFSLGARPTGATRSHLPLRSRGHSARRRQHRRRRRALRPRDGRGPRSVGDGSRAPPRRAVQHRTAPQARRGSSRCAAKGFPESCHSHGLQEFT